MILAPHAGTEEEGYELSNEWQLLRRFGILVEKLTYTSVWKKCKGLNPTGLIELLTHFQLAVKIVGPIETDIQYDDHLPKYFLPAVLPYHSSASLSTRKYDSQRIKATPLHITFKTGFAIPGFFTRLSTLMLKERNHACQKLSLFMKDGIYHDMVKYMVLSLPTAFVTLTERITKQLKSAWNVT